MKTIVRLRNPIRRYAWGSRRFLAELQGRPTPSPEPEAELWIGAHPAAPSEVELPSGPRSLAELIAEAPEAVLGAAVVERFGPRLPFLLKVLAAERPLSIQAHPDAEQARAGHARESAAGIPLDAPHRSYRDASHKPELLCAVTSFVALCGFRPAVEAAECLTRLGGAELAELAAPLAADDESEALRGFAAAWLGIPAVHRARLVAAAAAAAVSCRDEDAAFAWIGRLAALHPGDPGALAPAFLNLIELAPGEALFFEAGTLHAYLGGVGVEVMASSDNVLRGGLTEKHVDVPELLRILRFEAQPTEALASELGPGGERRYPAPAEEFALSVLELAPGAAFTRAADHAVEVLLCRAGRVRMVDEAGGELVLNRGEAALVPAAAGAYRVEALAGPAVVDRVTPGAAKHSSR